MGMKFCWATIMVENMEKSLEFYQEIVGLKLNRRFEAGPETEIAFLDGEGAEIELICEKNASGTEIGKGISLGFAVDSVDAKMAFVKEKDVAIQGGPFQPNPHIKFFYVTDPNGLKIQFVEHC